MIQIKPKATIPKLRFSPTAWAKLLYLRDLGDSEVGGFGVTPSCDLLYVEELVLVKQVCTPYSVVFDDGSVADHFDHQTDVGLDPEQFARIWIHTHPGNSPAPSTTDEETFARVFGECDWAVMFILAEAGQTYARLGFHAGPGGALEIPVEVDFRLPFQASHAEAWEQEYLTHVVIDEPESFSRRPGGPRRFDLNEMEAFQVDPWDIRWTIADPYLEEEFAPYE
jgi:hypothetical protein